MIRTVRDALFVLLLFVLDRISKYLALSFLIPAKPLVLGSFGGVLLQFTLTLNEGAAWGFFSEFPSLLLGIRLVFVGILLFCSFRCSFSALSRFSVLAILSGAMGNIFDTIYLGHVVDMVHIVLWGWDYPVFNVADSLIFLGCCGYLCDSFRKRA